MTFWDDISVVFSGNESRGNGDIITDMSDDTVNGWVDAKSFTNNGIQNRELTKFLVGHGTDRPVGVAEIFYLFLVNGITVTSSE